MKPEEDKSKKEESELEEILEEESENENSKEKPKEKPKKLPTIIPEFRESRARNFLNFLNKNSSTTLDIKNPLEELPKNLESNLEKSEEKSASGKIDNEENPFEYISKEEKEKELYKPIEENLIGTSQKNKHFREMYSESNPMKKEFTNYETINVQPKNLNEKEDFKFQESKMDYYSHK